MLDRVERDRRLRRVVLRGLSRQAVGDFLPPGTELAPDTARTLYDRTAGNPFFLRELVRLLAERGDLGGDGAALALAVPDRVREVVGQRLEPLAPTTREVLAIAGVVGRPFTIAGVARVGALPREAVAQALEPALAGRLVEIRPDAPGRFGFAHAIVRDAVYDDVPTATRARLHGAVAAVLRESLDAGGDATAAEAARHALAAARAGGDPQPAWALSLEAAEEAARLQAHAEAATNYAGALEAVELGAEATVAERLETSLALAAATHAAGDIEEARRRFRSVAAAARPDGGCRRPCARGARVLGGAALRRGRRGGDRPAAGGARGAAAAGQRAARTRTRRARPASRPGRRPIAPRGADRRGRGHGGAARGRGHAGGAAVDLRPGQLDAGARGGAARGDRRAARRRGPGRGPGLPAVGADDPAARRAGGRRPRHRRRGAGPDRGAGGREPPRVPALVPARAAGHARAVRLGPDDGGAPGRGGRRAQPPPRRRRGAGVHRPAPRARDAAPPATGRAAGRPARVCDPLSVDPGVAVDARGRRVDAGARGRGTAQCRRARSGRVRRSARPRRIGSAPWPWPPRPLRRSAERATPPGSPSSFYPNWTATS